MVDATTLVSQARAALAQTDLNIGQHPYLRAVTEKRVSLEGLQAFPAHQYHIAESGVRSYGTLIRRFGQTSALPFFRALLDAEIRAQPAIVAHAAKLGMDEPDLRNYEPKAEAFAYATYVAWLADYGSAAEMACGLLVNLAAWSHNCAVLGQSLRSNYGFTEADTAFVDMGARLEPDDEPVLAIVQDDLDRGVPPTDILRAARLFEAYEAMFWDRMAGYG